MTNPGIPVAIAKYYTGIHLSEIAQKIRILVLGILWECTGNQCLKTFQINHIGHSLWCRGICNSFYTGGGAVFKGSRLQSGKNVHNRELQRGKSVLSPVVTQTG